MSASPIFVHSLFRAGSTYVFQVFRRSPVAYTCYQEPMHEAAWYAQHQPAFLLQQNDDSTQRLLRHPTLSAGYFQELHDAWPAWQGTLQTRHIYDAHFAEPGVDCGEAFWQALVKASPGRPVFQDCRSTGRMGALKAAMGGHHLYLWRNPWDQWWSYKVAPYFDGTTRFILLASHAPGVLQVLCQRWGIQPPPTADLAQGFAHFAQHPLPDNASYQAFYALWCLALRASWAHADLLLNIDQLSDSAAHRHDTLAQLEALGITGLDLADCQVPQRLYTQAERDFFTEQERAVHNDLLADGWTQQEVQDLQAQQHAAAPTRRAAADRRFEARAEADREQRLKTLHPHPAHAPAPTGTPTWLRRWLRRWM